MLETLTLSVLIGGSLEVNSYGMALAIGVINISRIARVR